MKFFDSIQERSKQVFYATCSDLARLNLDYDDGNQHKEILLNLIKLRSILRLPVYSLDRDEDFTNYIIAVENANLNAVTFFSELGCDPFNKANIFHDRLFKEEHSINTLIEKLKKRIAILDPSSKEFNRFNNMIEWLDLRVISLTLSNPCLK